MKMKETSEEILIIAQALYQRDRDQIKASFDFLEYPIFPHWEMLSKEKRETYISQATDFLAFLLARDFTIVKTP